MIRLLNDSPRKFKYTMTKNPVTHPEQSPMPLGVMIEDLDPKKNPEDKKKLEQTLIHPNYSESEDVVFKPGINTFENDEHAEKIYMELGNPEEGGIIPIGAGGARNVTNENFVFEVNEKGEIIQGKLHKKYRQPVGSVRYKSIDPELTHLKKQEA